MSQTGDRIVMVAYTYYPWDPRVRREAETLVRLGHDVSVVTARDAGQPARETVAGVIVRRLPLTIRRGGVLRYLFQYATFFLLSAASLRRERGTAVHVHSLPDFLVFVALGARVRGIPVVLDLHEAMPEIYAARFPRSTLGRRLAIAAEKASCLLASRVIVVNETIRDLLVGRGVPADRLVVVYNSPDVSHLEIPARSPRGDGLRLVYAGAVNPERDLATLVRAVSELRPSTRLEIYGPGPAEYRAYLNGLADGLGLRDLVRIGGVLPAEQVLECLAAADVGVVTYERNPITEVGLPNKVFEYVALDKPLVLPDLRAMRRAFDGAALFYEPGDPASLAARIHEAAAGGPSIETMRANARVVYDAARWDVQAKRLAGVYAPPAGGRS